MGITFSSKTLKIFACGAALTFVGCKSTGHRDSSVKSFGESFANEGEDSVNFYKGFLNLMIDTRIAEGASAPDDLKALSPDKYWEWAVKPENETAAKDLLFYSMYCQDTFLDSNAAFCGDEKETNNFFALENVKQFEVNEKLTKNLDNIYLNAAKAYYRDNKNYVDEKFQGSSQNEKLYTLAVGFLQFVNIKPSYKSLQEYILSADPGSIEFDEKYAGAHSDTKKKNEVFYKMARDMGLSPVDAIHCAGFSSLIVMQTQVGGLGLQNNWIDTMVHNFRPVIETIDSLPKTQRVYIPANKLADAIQARYPTGAAALRYAAPVGQAATSAGYNVNIGGRPGNIHLDVNNDGGAIYYRGTFTSPF